MLAPNAKDATVSSKNIFFTFQYNPEKLIHTFSQGLPSTLNSNTADQGPPTEFFSLTFELDSVDIELSSQNRNSADLGLHPALAVLELMMQPQIVANQASMPIVVFKWGAKRSVAVRLVSISVEEKSFDVTLNPTRATVSLTLRVLDAAEINNNSGARSVCLNHQSMRTTLVDAYKLQTGQAVSMAAGDASSVSAAAAAAGSSVQSKTKISA